MISEYIDRVIAEIKKTTHWPRLAVVKEVMVRVAAQMEIDAMNAPVHEEGPHLGWTEVVSPDPAVLKIASGTTLIFDDNKSDVLKSADLPLTPLDELSEKDAE